MEWNECLNDWGTRLRGLAQGGLHYGGDGETGLVRYRRVREIALQMMDSTDCVDDGEVTEMACKLQKRVAGMTEEQAGSLARELLGKKAGVTEEQVHAWGAELVEMADTGLAEGLESPFDLDRYQVIHQLGEKMQALAR